MAGGRPTLYYQNYFDKHEFPRRTLLTPSAQIVLAIKTIKHKRHPISGSVHLNIDIIQNILFEIQGKQFDSQIIFSY